MRAISLVIVGLRLACGAASESRGGVAQESQANVLQAGHSNCSESDADHPGTDALQPKYHGRPPMLLELQNATANEGALHCLARVGKSHLLCHATIRWPELFAAHRISHFIAAKHDPQSGFLSGGERSLQFGRDGLVAEIYARLLVHSIRRLPSR